MHLASYQSYIDGLNRIADDLVNVSFLKEESRKKLRSECTINDFIPDQITEFEKAFKKNIEETSFENEKRRIDANIIRIYERSFSDLKKTKKIIVESNLKLKASKVADGKIKLFRQGETIQEVMTRNVNSSHEYLFIDNKDFEKPANVFKCKSTQDIINRSERDANLARARHKAEKNKKNSERHKFFDNYKIVNEFYKNGNFIDGLHSQIKFYLLVSANLQRPLNEITEEDIRNAIHLAEDMVKKSQQNSEKRAKEAAEALLLEESKNALKTPKKVNKPQKTSQKNTKKTESEDQIRKDSKEEVVNPPQDPICIAISQIHKSQSDYILAPRVLRWGTKNIADIRQFSDWDPTINQRVSGYLQYSEEQLWQEKNCHNLIGIEKFVSQPILKQNHCFEYSYLDPKSNCEKNGLGIYAVKVDQKGKKEAGVIYLGIDDKKRIYHAAFVSINDHRFLPNQLVQKFDEEKNEPEEKWSTVTECSFNLLEDHVVQMQIGKKNPICYHLYPLK